MVSRWRRAGARLTGTALLLAGMPVIATVAGQQPAAAQGFLTLRPTTTADVVDAGDGLLSLREAVAQTNASADQAAITLQRNATYVLDECTAGALAHTAATAGLTLNGNGATVEQTCDGDEVVRQDGDGLLNLVDIGLRGGGIRATGAGEIRFSNSALGDSRTPAIVGRGAVAVSGSTIAGTSTSAAAVVDTDGTLTVVKSTIRDNAAADATLRAGGAVVLVYATLAGDRDPVVRSAGSLTVFGSFVEGTCSVDGAVTSLGHNAAATSCGGTGAIADVGLVPSPGPKGVDVLSPSSASPLVDAIPASECVPASVRPLVPPYAGITSDQLGVRRPQGGACDIGAIELIQGSLQRDVPEPARTPDDPRAPAFEPPQPGGFVSLKPTTTADVVDADDGKLSLREAFALGDATGAEVAITLQRRAVYRLELCAAPALAVDNEANELVHTTDLGITVTGNGATVVQTCDGAGVFVQLGNGLFILHDLTILGGRSTHGPGGGVFSAGVGEVRMTNAVVRDNTSVAAGGGLASFGDVNMSGVTFTDNHSDERAGAIAALGRLLLVKSSIYDNTAVLANGGVEGGNGVTLVYSTLVGNSQPQVEALGPIASFASVIVGPGHGASCHSLQAPTSLGHNVAVHDEGASCGIGTGPGDVVDVDPGLTLQPGPWGTPIYAPLPGSAVVDTIPVADCLPASLRPLVPPFFDASSDQLGVRRPQGSGCDVGAVELLTDSLQRPVTDPPRAQGLARHVPAPGGALVVTTRADVVDPADGKLSLREAVGAANAADHDAVIVLRGGEYRLERCQAPLLAADNEANELSHTSHLDLTVLGNGATVVQTCDGAGVFLQYGDGTFTLSDITVTGGRVTQTPGGGIYSAGTGEVRLVRSWLTDNETVAAGGGLTAFGDIVLLSTTISGNRTPEFAGAVAGTKNLLAVNSSIFGNTAGLALGGLGVHTGTMTLVFTTIHDNTSPNVDAGKLVSFASVVSAPRPAAFPPGPPPNCTLVEPTTSFGGNVDTTSTCGFGGGPGDRNDVGDVKLLPQRGEHPYLVPAHDSPLVDLVPVTGCAPADVAALVPGGYDLTRDQTGTRRPRGNGCDTGAIERPQHLGFGSHSLARLLRILCRLLGVCL